ncbi:MAG: thioredoxin [Chloroflexi bacterium]|nr:thioredoxin [Chloroflexota bacterium]
MPFDTPIHTNAQSIDRVLAAGLPVVLVFWRKDCHPCRQLDPRLSWLAGQYAGKILFAKVDADSESELVKRYHIQQLPALVFIKNGQVEATAYGASEETALRQWCDYLVHGGVKPMIPTGPSVALAGKPASSQSRKGNGAAARAVSDKPLHLTDDNFDRVIASDLPVLVDFWAPWCGPCHMIAPTVEALAKEYAGRLVVGKLNVDENPLIASRYGIMSIPTLLIFKNGKPVDQIVGAVPAPLLRQRVAPHVR